MPKRTLFVVALCAFAAGCGKKEKTTAELIDDLKGQSPRDRLIAVRLLPQRKSDAAEVVPALIEAAQSKDVDVRLSAVVGLGSFGDQAKDAVPVLEAARKDHDARVREAAKTALIRIEGKSPPGK